MGDQKVNFSPSAIELVMGVIRDLHSEGRIPEGERDAVDRASADVDRYPINVLALAQVVHEYGNNFYRNRLEALTGSVDGRRIHYTRFAESADRIWKMSREDRSGIGFKSGMLLGYPKSSGRYLAALRAMESANPLSHADPDELVRFIFEPLGSDGLSGSRDLTGDQREAWGAVTEGILRQFDWTFRRDGKQLTIPPPSSRELADALGVPQSNIAFFERTPSWGPAMMSFFVEALVDGISGDGMSPDAWEDANRLKEAWYGRLVRMGFRTEDFELAIDRHFKKADADDGDENENEAREIKRTIALAELSRFAGDMKAKPQDAENAAEAFFDRLIAVHRLDPFLTEKRFMQLLLPLARPMTLAGMKELMKRHPDDKGGFKKFQVDTIMAWHSYGPEELTKRLAWQIGRNQKDWTFEEFLSRMFDVKPATFFSMMARLESKGADVGEVREKIEEKFPGALFDERIGPSGRMVASALMACRVVGEVEPEEDVDDGLDEARAAAEESASGQADVAVQSAAATSSNTQLSLPLTGFAANPTGK